MRGVILIICLLGLSACSGTGSLHDFDNPGAGPDDFSVLSAGPLTVPDTLALPAPTPGGTNRTDRNPKADAIAALGGRQSASVAGGIPAQDAALVTHAGRGGVAANIRADLAAADAALRGSRVRGLYGRGGYFGLYANQALDAQAELARFRAAGVATPSAPPAN